MFRKPSSILPDVPIYALEWGFSDQFGGITNSMLQRTNAFADLGNRKMTILTVAPELEPKRRAHELRDEGKLSKRITVKNMWDELRSLPDRKLLQIRGNADLITEVPVCENLSKQEDQYHVEVEDKTGKVVRTEYFRPDGSVLASDRRDWSLAGEKVRRITLFTRKGTPAAQWTNLSQVYFSWVDSIVGSNPCVIITDTSGIGGRMRNYHRDNVVKVQMLHNIHLAVDPSHGVEDALNERWKNVMVNSDNYEVLGVLTDDQKRDVAETQLNTGNLKILSNMYHGQVLTDIRLRTKSVGIQVSRLAEQKRIDHTIQAIANSHSATIDIYGFANKVEHETWLNGLIEDLNVTDRVRLKGYDPRARERFKDASFSLLPSLFEGQPLVIIESMAAGCIPIAYDVKYGARSMIDHGVDGFLVPGGDLEALTAMIDHVTNLDDETLARMRRNATEKAKRYLPERIVEDWGRVLREALESKPTVPSATGIATAVNAQLDEVKLSIRVKITGASDLDENAAIAWKSRTAHLYGRVSARCTASGGGYVVEGEIPVERLDRGGKNIFDTYVDVRLGGHPMRLRIKSTELDVPSPAGNLEPYSTINSNLSVRKHVSDL